MRPSRVGVWPTRCSTLRALDDLRADQGQLWEASLWEGGRRLAATHIQQIEWDYSRASAFSNRRCQVPSESTARPFRREKRTVSATMVRRNEPSFFGHFLACSVFPGPKRIFIFLFAPHPRIIGISAVGADRGTCAHLHSAPALVHALPSPFGGGGGVACPTAFARKVTSFTGNAAQLGAGGAEAAPGCGGCGGRCLKTQDGEWGTTTETFE